MPPGDDTVYYYITLVASKPDGRSDSTTTVLRVRSGVIPTGTAQCAPAAGCRAFLRSRRSTVTQQSSQPRSHPRTC